MGTIDGTSWSDVTIDGDPVQEITVDGSVVWTSFTPTSSFNGFEDISPWAITHGGRSNTYSHSGTYSYHSSESSITDEQAIWEVYPDGAQASSFTYWYRESGANTGGGVRLKNSNGNYEGGTATNNPQFSVDFDSAVEEDVSSNANYDTWVKVNWNFDWPNNQVTVSFDAADGSDSFSNTYTLKQGVDISKIELWNYGSGWGVNSIQMYWDDIDIVVPGPGGFEDMGPWTTYTGYQDTSKTYEGDYSYYCGDNGSGIQAKWTPYSNGKQVSYFEYHYWEKDPSSSGGGVKLKNSNGNLEIGTATDNPEYFVEAEYSYGDVADSGNYASWVTVSFDFDWSAGTVDVTFEDPNAGFSHSDNYKLMDGTDISTVEIRNFGGSWNSGDIDMWFDNFNFR